MHDVLILEVAMSLMMKPGLGRPRAGPSDVTRRDLEDRTLHQNIFQIASPRIFRQDLLIGRLPKDSHGVRGPARVMSIPSAI